MLKRAIYSSLVIKTVLSRVLLLSFLPFYGIAGASTLAEVEQRPVISPGFYDLYPGRLDVGGGASITLPSRALLLEQTDISIKGFSSPIRIKRIYRSDRKNKGVIGRGWRIASIPSLLPSENHIILTTAYGITVFTKKEAGSFVATNGLTIKEENPGFILQATDSSILRFSESGQILSKQDANKNRTSYRYVDSRLVEISDKGSSRSIGITYNNAGQIASIKDNSGRKASYKYNNDGQLSQVIQPDQQKISYRYQTGVLSGIVRDGRADLNINYDNSGDGVVRRVSSGNDRWLEVKTIASKGGLSVEINDSRSNRFQQSFSEKKGGIKVELTGENGWRAEYLFSTSFSLLEAHLPDGYSLSKQYDDLGRLITVRDNRGRDTVLNYKGTRARPDSVIDKQAGTVSFRYDDRNNLSSVKKNKHKISYDYSKTGKLLAIYANSNKLTTYRYDKSGNEIERTSYGYLPVRKSYDTLGRVVEEQNNFISDKSFRYDPSDRITRITSGKKDSLDFKYSPVSALKSITGTDGSAVSYEYDNYARPIFTVLPDGSRFERRYQYTGTREIVSTLFPGGNKIKLIRDALNHPTEFVDSLGNSTRYDWTNTGQPKRIIFADKTSIEHSYDKTGRPVKSTYSDGTEETFQYDGSRLEKIGSGDFQREYHYRKGVIEPVGFTDKPVGLKIEMTYTASNKLKSIGIPGTGKIHYSYDRHDQLVSITDPHGKRYEFTYNKGGYLSNISYPNQVKQLISINRNIGSVDFIEIKNKSTVLLKRKYKYQDNQFIAGFEDENSNRVQYNYGLNDELIEVTYLNGKDKERIDYRYDPNGNLIREEVKNKATDYQYSGIGNLVKKGEQSFRYDKRGNLIEIDGSGQRVSLNYSVSNKLTSVTKTDGEQKQYGYDPLGHLVYVKYQGKATYIIWYGNHRLLEVDENGQVNKVYIYGGGVDRLLAVLEDGKARYFHQDKIGTAILVTNEEGAVLSRPEYDPYGNPRGKNLSYENYWFSGRPYDPVIDAYYLRARYYFPKLKRFSSRDPVSGNMLLPTTTNPYLYALNNPVNASDPGGHFLMFLATTAGIAVITTGVIAYKVAEAIGGGAGLSSVQYRDGEYQAADVRGSTERLGHAVREVNSLVNNLGGTGTSASFTTGLDPSSSALGFGLTASARLGILPIPNSNTVADAVLNPGMINAMSDPSLSGSQQLEQGTAYWLNENISQLSNGFFVSAMNTGVLRSLPGLAKATLKGATGIFTRAGLRVVSSLSEVAQAGFQAATVPGARQAAQTAAATAAGTALSGAGASANAQANEAAAASKAALDRFKGEVGALKNRCNALDTLRAKRRMKLEDATRLASEIKAAVSDGNAASGRFLQCTGLKQYADRLVAKVKSIAPKATQGNQGARSLLQRCNTESDLEKAAKLQRLSGSLAKEMASAYQQLSAVLTSKLPLEQNKARADLAKIENIKAKLNLAKVKSVTMRNYQDSARAIAARVAELKNSCNNTYSYLSQEIQKRAKITGDAGFKTLLANLAGVEVTINTREFNPSLSGNVDAMINQANDYIADLPGKEAGLNECVSYDVVSPLLQAQVQMAQIKNVSSWDSEISSLRGQCRTRLDAVADKDQKPDTEGTEFEPPRDQGEGCSFRGRDGKCMDNVIGGTPRGVGVGGTPVVVNPTGGGAGQSPEQGSTTGQSGAGTDFGTYGEDPRERERQSNQRAENQADINRAQGRMGADGRPLPGGGRPGSDIATSFGTPTLPDDPVINEPASTAGQAPSETSDNTIAGTGKPQAGGSSGTAGRQSSSGMIPGTNRSGKPTSTRRAGGSNSAACRSAINALLTHTRQAASVISKGCGQFVSFQKRSYSLLSAYEKSCGRAANGKDILLRQVTQMKKLCRSAASSSGGKPVKPRRPVPSKPTGCRWKLKTIAGYGANSAWSCVCDGGTYNVMATKYCGAKPPKPVK